MIVWNDSQETPARETETCARTSWKRAATRAAATGSTSMCMLISPQYNRSVWTWWYFTRGYASAFVIVYMSLLSSARRTVCVVSFLSVFSPTCGVSSSLSLLFTRSRISNKSLAAEATSFHTVIMAGNNGDMVDIAPQAVPAAYGRINLPQGGIPRPLSQANKQDLMSTVSVG